MHNYHTDALLRHGAVVLTQLLKELKVGGQSLEGCSDLTVRRLYPYEVHLEPYCLRAGSRLSLPKHSIGAWRLRRT